jgi:hypothetical protein
VLCSARQESTIEVIRSSSDKQSELPLVPAGCPPLHECLPTGGLISSKVNCQASI